MNEEKTNKRGWVKNAAIVFLTVLLILTFFSNTIMNWSLPEVAVRQVTSANISTQIRGTATVKATETYEVVLDQSRRVKTVYAKRGEEVRAGDLLFVLSEEDSAELESAKSQYKSALETLESMKKSYEESVLRASMGLSGGKSEEERAIENLRKQLKADRAERSGLDLSDKLVKAAEEKVTAAELTRDSAKRDRDQAAETAKYAADTVAKQQSNISQLEDRLSKLNTGDPNYNAVDAARRQLDAANENMDAANEAFNQAVTELGSLRLLYGDCRGELEKYAKQWIVNAAAGSDSGAPSAYDSDVQDKFDKLSIEWRSKLNVYFDAYLKTLPYDNETLKGYNAIRAAEETVEAKTAAVQRASQSLMDANSDWSSAWDSYQSANRNNVEKNNLNNELNNARILLKQLQEMQADEDKELQKANDALEKAEAAIQEARQNVEKEKNELENRKARYNSLTATIDQETWDLDKMVNNYNISKELAERSDEETRQRIADQEAQVAQLEEKMQRLSGVTGGTEVYAEINGVIKTVNVTAGNTVSARTPLATIEVPDRGYTAEISVTNEQAQNIYIGDFAQVTTGWWGQRDITAQLTGIRSDPANPRNARLLIFTLTGADVESGANITLSIGQRGQTYNTVVPKSAVRSDTNGDFVLIVTIKQTPLSNRYIAQRVDVRKLAEDDNSVAIAGEINYGDTVITTTTGLVESGMQIRMAEG